MDKAWKLLLILVFINFVIYIVGTIAYKDIFTKVLNPAGEKLAPYGIEILHLR